jgi:hypothetical protein
MVTAVAAISIWGGDVLPAQADPTGGIHKLTWVANSS